MRKISYFITVLLLFLLLGAGGAGWLAYTYTLAPENVPEDLFFQVRKGETVSGIAAMLQEKGIIRSALALKIYARIMKTESNLQTGYYSVPEGAGMIQVHDLLLTGRQYLVSVTIPEGYTIKHIAGILEDKGVVPASDFLSAASNRGLLEELGIPAETAEGYIYPDTYRMALETPAEMVVRHMVTTFKNTLDRIQVNTEDYSSTELYQRVILASIIEREYRQPSEAPLIASVFFNRLKINMPLQSCATVVYVITELKGKEHPAYLTYADLEISSDYNTYQHYGLPPGPICNPGEVALHAAFFPEESSYLYFVLEDPEAGFHKFSETLYEHNAAKRLYIKAK